VSLVVGESSIDLSAPGPSFTSDDETVVITVDGSTVDLSVPGGGAGVTDITSVDESVTVEETSPGVFDLSAASGGGVSLLPGYQEITDIDSPFTVDAVTGPGIIFVNSTAADMEIILPDPADCNGREVYIERRDETVFSTRVDPDNDWTNDNYFLQFYGETLRLAAISGSSLWTQSGHDRGKGWSIAINSANTYNPPRTHMGRLVGNLSGGSDATINLPDLDISGSNGVVYFVIDNAQSSDGSLVVVSPTTFTTGEASVSVDEGEIAIVVGTNGSSAKYSIVKILIPA
jgi:hypothetical protein